MELNTSENTPERKSFSKRVLIAVIAIAFLGGFLVSAAFDGGNPVYRLVNKDSQTVEDVDFSLFWKVWDDLQKKYVEPAQLDPKTMVYGAIKGMVDSVGDPYTVFLEPESSKKFESEIAGSFGGVGIEIDKRNDVLMVVAPIRDTPAFKAGILAGDKILEIDGKSTQDLSIDEAVKLIRGRPGTKVTLGIIRNGKEDMLEFSLIRENIRIPATNLKYIDNNNNKIAYLQIHMFNQNVVSEFRKNSQDILKNNPSAIVLDLRNNPGGLLDAAVDIAGYFLDSNALVTKEEFGDGKTNDFLAMGGSALKSYPVVILVNGGSASASEILAGALHDNRGIKLVGDKTFGKGLVQELQKYSDDSSLKVTVARWLTPNGVNISKTDLEPDIKIVIPKDADPETVTIGEPGKDPQLDKALEILR